MVSKGHIIVSVLFNFIHLIEEYFVKLYLFRDSYVNMFDILKILIMIHQIILLQLFT